MNYELKDMISKVYDFGDDLDELYPTPGDMPLREILRIDFLQFLMYLSASDGTISDEESNFIEEYLDYHLSPSSIKDFIKNIKFIV